MHLQLPNLEGARGYSPSLSLPPHLAFIHLKKPPICFASLGFTTQIAVPPTGVSPPTPRQSRSQSSSASLITHGNGSDGSSGSGSFTLNGKPFLRALFRSLEVGPGTDYDTFFALSLLIAIKQNGGKVISFSFSQNHANIAHLCGYCCAL